MNSTSSTVNHSLKLSIIYYSCSGTFLISGVDTPMCALAVSMNPSSKGQAGWQCSGSSPPIICTGSVSNWGGVTCVSGAVTSISLAGLQLTGSIPTQLGLMTTLTRLQLNNNLLTSSIPSSLSGLSDLTYLDLGYNSFQGTVPTQLGGLAKLQYLNFAANSLSYMVPVSFCGLSALTSLSFVSNPQLVCYFPCLSTVKSRNYGSVPNTCTDGKITCPFKCSDSLTKPLCSLMQRPLARRR